MGLLSASSCCQKPLCVLYFQSCTQYLLVHVPPCLKFCILPAKFIYMLHLTLTMDNRFPIRHTDTAVASGSKLFPSKYEMSFVCNVD